MHSNAAYTRSDYLVMDNPHVHAPSAAPVDSPFVHTNNYIGSEVPSARPSINPAGIQSAPAQQQQPVHTRPGNVGGDATTVGPTVGLNLRQDSLDVIASTELTRTKTMGGSQTLFADVLEQLSSKEESLPAQAALYSLPSMQFLESLLDEMDSRNASAGHQPHEPPLYLPIDSFDLPGLDIPGSSVNDLTHLALPPLPRRVQSANNAMFPTNANGNPTALGHDPYYRVSSQQITYVPIAPTAGSAAPSPQRGVPIPRHPGPAAVARRAATALEELYGLEEAETSFQTSKSGRVRKVTSFTGAKRKLGDVMPSQVSAPAALAGEPISHYHHLHSQSHLNNHTYPDSDMTNTTDDGEEINKELKRMGSKKSKRTVCLNCGSHQTPQWRCGPLGPRTLCNACGVRYKKGLPLNCWPLREGMVLPPGAVLPPTVQVPPGLNIITQPLESE